MFIVCCIWPVTVQETLGALFSVFSGWYSITVLTASWKWRRNVERNSAVIPTLHLKKSVCWKQNYWNIDGKDGRLHLNHGWTWRDQWSSNRVNHKVVSLLNYLSTMPWKHMGEWRYSSTFLDLDTRWRWVVSFRPLPLYPRKPPPIPFG
jgi:hypothetical protein